MDKFTPEHRRKSMQANKSKGTNIEVLLGKALFGKGLRYRKNNRKIHGTPDFSMTKYKIAIFADGDFWHGKDWETRREKLGKNAAFWFEKMERNIERDFKVNQKLRSEGWTVLRFWESDIKKNFDEIAGFVKDVVEFKKQKIQEGRVLRKQMLHSKKEHLIQNYLERKKDDFPQSLKQTALKYTREFLCQKYPEEEITTQVAEDLLRYGAPNPKRDQAKKS